MRTRRQSRTVFCKATLAVLFVAAQIAVVSHFDLDQHSQETPCAICLSVSTFGSANVTHPELILPLRHSPQAIHEWLVFVSTDLDRFQRARAPPSVS